MSGSRALDRGVVTATMLLARTYDVLQQRQTGRGKLVSARLDIATGTRKKRCNRFTSMLLEMHSSAPFTCRGIKAPCCLRTAAARITIKGVVIRLHGRTTEELSALLQCQGALLPAADGVVWVLTGECKGWI